MGNLFNMDGGLMSGLGKVFDLMLISIVWLICCIPIFTAGAATTALYYTVVKVVRHDRGYLLKEYFKSFRMNFKSGTLIWIVILVFSIILSLNIMFSKQFGGNLGYILFSIYRTMLVILLSLTVFIFPNLSRFVMGKRQLIKTSLLMSIKHLPTTITVDILVIGTGFIVLLMPVAVFLLPGVCCLLCSFFIERVLKKYIPKDDRENENADLWYLE